MTVYQQYRIWCACLFWGCVGFLLGVATPENPTDPSIMFMVILLTFVSAVAWYCMPQWEKDAIESAKRRRG